MVITSTTQYRVWHTVGRLNASGDCFTKFSDSEVSYFCTLTRSVKNMISSKCIFYNLQAKRAFQMKSMARGLSLSIYIYMYIYIYIYIYVWMTSYVHHDSRGKKLKYIFWI